MIINLLRGVCGLLVTIAAILFAVANRAAVPVNWSPINPPASLPVYLIALAALAIGFLLGAFMVWLNGGALRREHRKLRKRHARLEEQLEMPATAAPPATPPQAYDQAA